MAMNKYMCSEHSGHEARITDLEKHVPNIEKKADKNTKILYIIATIVLAGNASIMGVLL